MARTLPAQALRLRSVGAGGRRQHLVAAALLMLLALIYLWPVLVAGNVLAPNSVLFAFWPWHAAAPPGVGGSWNPLLADVPRAYYPWAVLARRLIHAGTFPAWNPYAYSGTPFYANPQTALLSPFNLPLWILSLSSGLALSTWFKLWLGGLGAYLLVRELRLGFWPGILAGASFMLCAFNVLWLTDETLPAVAATFPWAVLMSERVIRRRTLEDGIGIALVSAIAIFAGQPEVAAQVLAGALLYLILRGLTMADLTLKARIGGICLGAGGFALGTLLAAAVLLPDVRAGLGTPGAAARRNGDFTLPWLTLKNIVFPNWWPRLVVPQPEPYDYLERTAYVGVPATVLAVAAVLTRTRWREKLPLGVLAVLGIAIPFGVPGIRWIANHLPGLGATQLPRLLLWFELAAPVLAAFGLQALIQAPRRQRITWLAIALALVVAIAGVLTIDPSLHELRTALNHFRTGFDYADPKIISLTSVGWWAIFTVAIAVALLMFRVWRRPSVAAAMIALTAMLDLLHFASGFQPMLPAAEANPPATPAIVYLQRHLGEGRFTADAYTLGPDSGIVYGLRDVRGYDPPQPSYRYFRLWRLANPAQKRVFPYVVSGFSAAGMRVMSLLGARYVVESPGSPAPFGLARSRVYTGNDGSIYVNANAAPRALVASRVLTVATERDELRLIGSGVFDPRKDVLVQRDEPGARGLRGEGSSGTATVLRDANSNVLLRADLTRAGIVVLDDVMAPGWSVTVDGMPRRPLEVDDVMLGVSVPAGTHLIRWSYRVPDLALGALLSIVSLAALALAGAFAAARRRRR